MGCFPPGLACNACLREIGTGEFTSTNPYGSPEAVPKATTVVPMKASGVLSTAISELTWAVVWCRCGFYGRRFFTSAKSADPPGIFDPLQNTACRIKLDRIGERCQHSAENSKYKGGVYHKLFVHLALSSSRQLQALKLDSILVILVAAVVTALVGGLGPVKFAGNAGQHLVANRSMAIFIIAYVWSPARWSATGLREAAAALIGKFMGATSGLVIGIYGVMRSIFAAFNVGFSGGVAGFVRPVIMPMAEGGHL